MVSSMASESTIAPPQTATAPMVISLAVLESPAVVAVYSVHGHRRTVVAGPNGLLHGVGKYDRATANCHGAYGNQLGGSGIARGGRGLFRARSPTDCCSWSKWSPPWRRKERSRH